MQETPKTEETRKSVGKGVGFERIRRITGYLVGSLEKWNDAKRAEERERVKHDAKEAMPHESAKAEKSGH